MSNTEFRYWAAYFVYKHKLEREANEKANREVQVSEEEEPRTTLGRRY